MDDARDRRATLREVAEGDLNDPVLEALWKRVLEGWGDERTHAALLEYALRSQTLPEIAGRYRALADDPDMGEVAKKRIDGVIVAATQMLVSMKTPRPGKVPLPITLSAFAVCALLLGWLALAFWGRH
jgi:hypothetical protein